MPAQKRETGKNYIGVVSDDLEIQFANATRSSTDRRIRAFFVSRMAAMFKRRREAL